MKNSDDNFINLTNDIKDAQKSLNNVEIDKIIEKSDVVNRTCYDQEAVPSLGSIGVETSLNKKIGLNME